MDTANNILQKYKGQSIAIATSGGVDSMTLCSLVLSSGYFSDITLLHVDHNLRATAKRDYELVKKIAAAHNLKFESISVDVAGEAKKNKRSIEHEAREVRYKFINEFSKESGALIMLGHTLDDNAETILMHIFRGCGLNGLAGMKEESDYPCKIVRPLIYTNKKDIYNYAKLNNIEFNEDETNSDTKYARNLIRKILEDVKKLYPNASKNTAKLSEVAQRALYITHNQLSEEYFKAMDGEVYLSKEIKGALQEDYYIIEAAKRAGLISDFESKHIEAILGLDNGKRLDLPNGFRVYSDKKHFMFQSPTIDGTPGAASPAARAGNVCDAAFGGAAIINHQSQTTLLADADKLEGATVRFRKNGDKFTKFGGKTKKLNDFFNEKGVPPRLRDSVPLLVKDSRILAVVGYEIADEVKVTKDTKRFVKLW